MNRSHHPKKPATLDWHRADIVAALRKSGWSLRRLSAHHGYASPNTLTHALAKPWPKGERLIAEAIGIDPAEIWPSRYRGRDGASRRHYSKRAPAASRAGDRRSVA